MLSRAPGHGKEGEGVVMAFPFPGSPCGGRRGVARGRNDKGADVRDASAPIMEDSAPTLQTGAGQLHRGRNDPRDSIASTLELAP